MDSPGSGTEKSEWVKRYGVSDFGCQIYLNLAIDPYRFLWSNLSQLQISTDSSRNDPEECNLDNEVIKKIRFLDMLLVRREFAPSLFRRLFAILARFTELVEDNYVLRWDRWNDWMGPEWNDECVEGHIRLKEAGRSVLAMRVAFQRDVGLHPNVSAEEITKTVQNIKELKFGCKFVLWEDIDLDPAAADGPTALGQALKL
jgi:hypothetical protein